MTDATSAAAPVETRLARFRNFCSDFARSPVAVISLILIVSLLFVSFAAPLVSPRIHTTWRNSTGWTRF
nr:hypothetical protein [Marinicella sp. W31]MDC2876216.1 hypothetical protein [Marinicella sp. W31]